MKYLPNSGCYSLVIRLAQSDRIGVGSLGEVTLRRGCYIYTGSAVGTLRSRLLRHVTREKKLRWHIDFLLSSHHAAIKNIVLYPARAGEECRHNQRIKNLPGALLPVPRFGASDCRAGCGSHLVYLARTDLGEIRSGFRFLSAADCRALSVLSN